MPPWSPPALPHRVALEAWTPPQLLMRVGNPSQLCGHSRNNFRIAGDQTVWYNMWDKSWEAVADVIPRSPLSILFSVERRNFHYGKVVVTARGRTIPSDPRCLCPMIFGLPVRFLSFYQGDVILNGLRYLAPRRCSIFLIVGPWGPQANWDSPCYPRRDAVAEALVECVD